MKYAHLLSFLSANNLDAVKSVHSEKGHMQPFMHSCDRFYYRRTSCLRNK